VPRISFFFGIAIYMYWDEAHHLRPHFHAEYGDSMAAVTFDGTVLGGLLPPRALRFVREWAALHQDELRVNWERARARETLERIAPLS
jgi:hypothetical protein